MSDVTFRYARTLPIERSRAFLMFTDPRHIDASSSPPGGSFESLSFDLLASGRHHYRSRDADARDSWGLRVFTAIEPGRSLTWQQSFSDASGAVARHPMAPAFPLVVRSTLTFDDAPGAPGSTTLSLTWEPDGGSEAERAFFASIHDGMRAGWDAIFIQFERYAIAMTAATPSPRVRTCLWFDGNADEAAELYVSLLPGSAVDRVHRPEFFRIVALLSSVDRERRLGRRTGCRSLALSCIGR